MTARNAINDGTTRGRSRDGFGAGAGVAGFFLCGAFWLWMVSASRILEGARGSWLSCGLFALFLGLPALGCAVVSGKRALLAAHGAAAVAILALAALPWHPRKAFLDDLEGLRPGMTVAQVRARMARYVENGEARVAPRLDVPMPAALPASEGAAYYRWNATDPRYNADLGKAEFKGGRLVSTEFLPD